MIVPAVRLMMTVEVPTVNVAPTADVSMLMTEIEALPARRVPVAVTVRLDPPAMSLFEVAKEPEMVSAFDTSSAPLCMIVPEIVRS